MLTDADRNQVQTCNQAKRSSVGEEHDDIGECERRAQDAHAAGPSADAYGASLEPFISKKKKSASLTLLLPRRSAPLILPQALPLMQPQHLHLSLIHI